MSVLVFCVVSVVWSVQIFGSFMVFNLWIGPDFIVESCSEFLIFQYPFLVTTLGLDLFSGAYLNKLLCLWCAVIENSSI